MKVLHLTLKKKWFDMILSGEKKEEYREIKPYWTARLKNFKYNYSHIEFRNGYGKNVPSIKIELKDIVVGNGEGKWGALPYMTYYVIKLGKIIK